MRHLIACGLALLLVQCAATAAADGMFSRNAKSISFGAFATSSDGRTTVAVATLDDVDNDNAFPAVLRVQVGEHRFERRFDFGLNVEILWSPDPNRFAITGSATGANEQYRTAIVAVTPSGLIWFDVTPIAEKAFGHPVKCGWPEVPNVGTVKWLSTTQLVVAAEIIDHSNCDSFGTFVAYSIRTGSNRVDGVYPQLEAKRRWGSDLGRELAKAPDGCIRNPKSCYVPANHPELNAR